MIATAAIVACFTLSAACILILHCQAILRRVTLRQHLRDAFRAAWRGQSPPRRPWPIRADYARLNELERDLGYEPTTKGER